MNFGFEKNRSTVADVGGKCTKSFERHKQIWKTDPVPILNNVENIIETYIINYLYLHHTFYLDSSVRLNCLTCPNFAQVYQSGHFLIFITDTFFYH